MSRWIPMTAFRGSPNSWRCPEFGTCLPRRQVPVLAWRPWEIAILQVTTITRVKDDFCLSFKNQYSKKSGRVFVVFLIAGGDFDTFSKIEVKSWGLYTNKSTFWNLLVPKLRKVDYINTVASLIFGVNFFERTCGKKIYEIQIQGNKIYKNLAVFWSGSEVIWSLGVSNIPNHRRERFGAVLISTIVGK